MSVLFHKHQTTEKGCMYHAAYAITGDEQFLNWFEDENDMHLRARLAQAGWIAQPLHLDCQELRMPREAWEKFLKKGRVAWFLAGYRLREGRHQVAIFWDGTGLEVSDSKTLDVWHTHPNAFINSNYGAPYLLEHLSPMLKSVTLNNWRVEFEVEANEKTRQWLEEREAQEWERIKQDHKEVQDSEAS